MVWLIYACAVLALVAAVAFATKVTAVKIDTGTGEQIARLKEISSAISEGAMAFLSREYKYVGIFAICFSVVIYFALNGGESEGINSGLYSAIAFLAGAATSSISAFLGMSIATKGNVRTTVRAQKSIGEAFKVAFHSGAVMGFGLVGLALAALLTIILIYTNLIGADRAELVMEMVAGFGLGGSTVALFGRVGGGIYTKAADVGADLVGKVEAGIPEDDPRNPAVVADNVGDNVGDIAGMGADLFGSLAEGTCAALVIGASAVEIAGNNTALLYPLLVSAIGVPVCLLTSFFARLSGESTAVEPVLKRQLLISTVLMSIAVYFLTQYAMVDKFTLGAVEVTRNGVLASLLFGLWSGLLIGYVTEYYTSHSYAPVRSIAKASETGAATTIIYGLSVGYGSAVIPVVAIAVTAFVSWFYAGMYGIAIAAIGMISTIATGLTIDAYGPVSDNAGGIAEMSELGPEIRKRTDTLDAAGNTTAAIGKGFAIGSAVLTALALFAAFLTRANHLLGGDQLKTVNLLSPMVFAGLLIGGVLPFIFTAQTMLAVGKAANGMIEEVRRQFREIPGLLEGKKGVRADYKKCVDISTSSALQRMVPPGLLVMITPLVIGVVFGVQALAGMLAGSFISGLVMALSSSNAGGAWDNAKKYIETGKHGGKGSDAHKAAVVGDTVGDPFKDTSGPSLNILMKLMAILSLVFVPFIISAHAALMAALHIGG